MKYRLTVVNPKSEQQKELLNKIAVTIASQIGEGPEDKFEIGAADTCKLESLPGDTKELILVYGDSGLTDSKTLKAQYPQVNILWIGQQLNSLQLTELDNDLFPDCFMLTASTIAEAPKLQTLLENKLVAVEGKTFSDDPNELNRQAVIAAKKALQLAKPASAFTKMPQLASEVKETTEEKSSDWQSMVKDRFYQYAPTAAKVMAGAGALGLAFWGGSKLLNRESLVSKVEPPKPQ